MVMDDLCEYMVEMIVQEDSLFVGKSIEFVGFCYFFGMYLMEINCRGEVILVVGFDIIFLVKDQFVFVGIVFFVVDLQRIFGLEFVIVQFF